MSLLHSITIPVGQGSTIYNISEPYIGITEQNQYFAQFNTELNTVLLLNIYYSNRQCSILYCNNNWQLISGSIPGANLSYIVSDKICKVGLNLKDAYVQILGGIAIADADGTISNDDTSISLASSAPTIYAGTEKPVGASFGLPGDLYIQITSQSTTNQGSDT